jgi:hypothetical protein
MSLISLLDFFHGQNIYNTNMVTENVAQGHTARPVILLNSANTLEDQFKDFIKILQKFLIYMYRSTTFFLLWYSLLTLV